MTDAVTHPSKDLQLQATSPIVGQEMKQPIGITG